MAMETPNVRQVAQSMEVRRRRRTHHRRTHTAPIVTTAALTPLDTTYRSAPATPPQAKYASPRSLNGKGAPPTARGGNGVAELLAEPVLDRERLLNDTVNTGVMAALIGGFALSTMQMGMVVPGEAAEQLTVVIYMLSVVSVRHGRDSALAHTARMHARQS